MCPLPGGSGRVRGQAPVVLGLPQAWAPPHLDCALHSDHGQAERPSPFRDAAALTAAAGFQEASQGRPAELTVKWAPGPASQAARAGEPAECPALSLLRSRRAVQGQAPVPGLAGFPWAGCGLAITSSSQAQDACRVPGAGQAWPSGSRLPSPPSSGESLLCPCLVLGYLNCSLPP